ncbi:hypothetical protein [Moorena producens]|uniref:hypothetical protein n=1 Tax=Moorena producens TaxID=1155739 RepID=UPI003C734BC8
MKQIIKVLAVFFLTVTVSFGVMSSPAHAISNADGINQILKYFDGGNVQYYTCRKGKFSSATFSLRSFNGELCNNSTTLASVAEVMCRPKNVENFIGSKCDKAAMNKLGAEPSNIEEKATNILVEEANNAGGNVAKLACETLSDFVPGVGRLISYGCGKIALK